MINNILKVLTIVSSLNILLVTVTVLLNELILMFRKMVLSLNKKFSILKTTRAIFYCNTIMILVACGESSITASVVYCKTVLCFKLNVNLLSKRFEYAKRTKN